MFRRIAKCCATAVLLAVLVLTLPGCGVLLHNAVRGEVRGEHFTFRDSASIDSAKLELQGYYSRSYWSRERSWGDRDSVVTRPAWPDTVSHPFVFWKDGAAFFNSTTTSVAYQKTYENGHAHFLDVLTRANGEREREPPWFGRWGAFHIQNDSISIQIMDGGVPYYNFSPYYAEEYNGIILNDTTFVIEEHIQQANGLDIFSSVDRDTTRMRAVYRFHRLTKSEKPDSENWTRTHPDLQ